jgi:hypothetical protein
MKIIQVCVYNAQWEKIKSFVERYSHGRSVSSYMRDLIMTEIERIEHAEIQQQQELEFGEIINDKWVRLK